MRYSRLTLFLTVATLGLAPIAFAADKAPEFVRIDETGDNRPRALQMSIVSYVPDDDDRLLTVDLVSAIHIGDLSYYAELNDRFRDYDVLLYELVAPKEAAASNQVERKNGVLSTTQIGMTKMLDLTFQLDGINYDRANFVHADLSPDELREQMDERGESLYVYFWRLFFASLDEYAKDPLGLKNMQLMGAALSPGQDDSFKTMIAYEMINLDAQRDMLGDDSSNAIIGARNQRAIDVLLREIDGGARRIGIFYGAAHMPDLEERLLEQVGLTYSETDWVDAWQLDGE